MPVVNPGIRRFLGSAIQRLFNGASFSAPLTHSAIPTRAASGTTATFTRATTATVQNNDGYLVTALAGEARFEGARRVRNLLGNTENLLGAGWTAVGGAPVQDVVAPDGTTTGWSKALANVFDEMRYFTTYNPAGRAGLGSVYLKGTGTVSIRLSNSIDQQFVTQFTLTSDWLRVPTSVNVANSTVGIWLIGIFRNAGDTATSVDIWHPQLEDITGRTDQTTPSEYVSVGVPTDWLGTEHVTNGTFDTDTTGWSTNGTTLAISSGQMLITNTGSFGQAYQTLSTTIGTKYTVSADYTLGTATRCVIGLGNTLVDAGNEVLGGNTQTAASGRCSLEFTATATTTYFVIGLDAGAATTLLVDNISVKPAYYHGSMVDGVKYFDTDLSGNPIPASTLLGYLAEGARTNLCLQSNAFTTTWTPSGLTPTQNVTGPDGATSAWTFTDSNAGATAFIYQSINLTAAAHAFSFLVKKTTGAQSAYPVAYATDSVNAIAIATIDTSNGVATIWTAFTGYANPQGTASCVSFNDDFWQVTISFTASATSWAVLFAPAGTTNPTQSTGTIDVTAQGSHVFANAQLELGSFASSYIATTTAAVTRNGDVLTYSSAGNIANAAGWVYAEVTALNSGATAQADVLTDSSGFALYSRNDLGKQRFYNGTLDVSLEDLSVPYANKKLAWSWTNAVSVLGAVNGTVASAAISGNLNIEANLKIGSGVGSALFGTIRNVRIGQRQLSASEMQAITA